MVRKVVYFLQELIQINTYFQFLQPKKVVGGRPFLAGPLEAKTDFEEIKDKVGGTFNKDTAIKIVVNLSQDTYYF